MWSILFHPSCLELSDGAFSSEALSALTAMVNLELSEPQGEPCFVFFDQSMKSKESL